MASDVKMQVPVGLRTVVYSQGYREQCCLKIVELPVFEFLDLPGCCTLSAFLQGFKPHGKNGS